MQKTWENDFYKNKKLNKNKSKNKIEKNAS